MAALHITRPAGAGPADDLELLDLPPPAFDSGCLLLLDLIVQLKFLLGFPGRSCVIVGHT